MPIYNPEPLKYQKILNPGLASGISLMGGTLNQLLGGYLGHKIEQDKERRQRESNKNIARLLYPNMSDEELEQFADVPSDQLQTVLQGLSSRKLGEAMGGMSYQDQGMQPQLEGLSPQQQVQPQQELQMPETMMQPENIQVNDIAPGDQSLTNPELEPSSLPELNQYIMMPAAKQQGANFIQGLRNAMPQLSAQDKKTAMRIIDAQQKLMSKDRDFNFNLMKFATENQLKQEKFNYDKARNNQQDLIAKQDKINKQYNPMIEDMAKKAHAAEMDNLRFDDLQNLIIDGDVGSHWWNVLVDMAGKGSWIIPKMDLTGTLTPDAQVATKIRADFAKNAKEALGTTRLTDNQIDQYMKTIPSLLQGPQAVRIVAERNKLINKIPIERYKISRDIIKKNNGIIPEDFEQKLESQMRPIEKKITKKITEVIKNARKDKRLQMAQKRYENQEIIPGFQDTVSNFLNESGLGAVIGGAGETLASGLRGIGSAVQAGGNALEELPQRAERALSLSEMLSMNNPMAFRR